MKKAWKVLAVAVLAVGLCSGCGTFQIPGGNSGVQAIIDQIIQQMTGGVADSEQVCAYAGKLKEWIAYWQATGKLPAYIAPHLPRVEQIITQLCGTVTPNPTTPTVETFAWLWQTNVSESVTDGTLQGVRVVISPYPPPPPADIVREYTRQQIVDVLAGRPAVLSETDSAPLLGAANRAMLVDELRSLLVR